MRMSRVLAGSPVRIMRVCVKAMCMWLAFAAPAGAATCPEEAFGTEIDAAGERLRALNKAKQPELDKKLLQLKSKKGWSNEDYREKGLDYLQDSQIAAYDARANELFARIDQHARPSETNSADCAELEKLKMAGQELLAVMESKSAYTLAKLDQVLLGSQAKVSKGGKDKNSPEENRSKSRSVKPQPAIPRADGVQQPWDTTTAPEAAAQPELALQMPPAEALTAEDGYTIEEIRAATSGFFGGISTGLAAAIEHAFEKSGRPTAYILGTEGGGAFLAGLRYGKGTLYLRQAGKQTVYWHGPTLGYDFGAEGSRTMFLIYRLYEPDRLFRRYAGIDGTAYLVGGVGLTFLKGGDVIMAPIRTGIGLRLGANVGYLRFSAKPSWNPF